MKKLLFLLSFFSSMLISGYEAHAADARRQPHAPHAIAASSECQLPERVKNILDSHAPKLRSFLEECNQHPTAHNELNVMRQKWLPGYYIKYGINRFNNAQKIKDVIHADKLTLMDYPEKHLYHVPGRPQALSDENYVVIAKEVIDNGSELSEDQAKQLVTCASKAKIGDIHEGNYVINKNGKVVIIDTGTAAQEHEFYYWEGLGPDRHAALVKRQRIYYAKQILKTVGILGTIGYGFYALNNWHNRQVSRHLLLHA